MRKSAEGRNCAGPPPRQGLRRPSRPAGDHQVSALSVGFSLIASFAPFHIVAFSLFAAEGIGLLSLVAADLIDPLPLIATLQFETFPFVALGRVVEIATSLSFHLVTGVGGFPFGFVAVV
jgi:hypothetical protein